MTRCYHDFQRAKDFDPSALVTSIDLWDECFSSNITSISVLTGVTPGGDMPPLGPNKPRTSLMMADKILQQSREAEHALADALVPAPPVHVVS